MAEDIIRLQRSKSLMNHTVDQRSRKKVSCVSKMVSIYLESVKIIFPGDSQMCQCS